MQKKDFERVTPDETERIGAIISRNPRDQALRQIFVMLGSECNKDPSSVEFASVKYKSMQTLTTLLLYPALAPYEPTDRQLDILSKAAAITAQGFPRRILEKEIRDLLLEGQFESQAQRVATAAQIVQENDVQNKEIITAIKNQIATLERKEMSAFPRENIAKFLESNGDAASVDLLVFFIKDGFSKLNKLTTFDKTKTLDIDTINAYTRSIITSIWALELVGKYDPVKAVAILRWIEEKKPPYPDKVRDSSFAMEMAVGRIEKQQTYAELASTALKKIEKQLSVNSSSTDINFIQTAIKAMGPGPMSWYRQAPAKILLSGKAARQPV